MYDFDTSIDRTAFDCLKWSYRKNCCTDNDGAIIPMWIADLDMASPPAVVKAVKERAAHPVYGYAGKPDDYYAAFTGWMKARHGADVKREWIVFSPGIVPAIGSAIRAYSEKGDGVAIMPPVYHPFRMLIEKNGRRVVEAPLALKGDRYEMDFDALDQACSQSRLLVLCSPHNPVGRVWSRADLERLAEIAERHNVVVVSDEIHADLVYAPHKHVPSFDVSPKLSKRLVACWAPSKTFNIAGFQVSYIVVPDAALRAKLETENDAAGLGSPNCVGVAAAVAAYREGGPWLDEALAYLRGNYEHLVTELSQRAPALRVGPLEGTFLAWVDFRGAGLDGDVHRPLLDRAGLWLDAGTRFGTGGSGYARLNLGCTRATLDEAIDRLVKAFGKS